MRDKKSTAAVLIGITIMSVGFLIWRVLIAPSSADPSSSSYIDEVRKGMPNPRADLEESSGVPKENTMEDAMADIARGGRGGAPPKSSGN